MTRTARVRRNRGVTTAALTAAVFGLGIVAAGPANASALPHGEGTVNTGSGTVGLNVRWTPDTTREVRDSLPNGWQFTIVCQQKSERVTGTVRTTDLWDRLTTGGWVSDAFVEHSKAAIPTCAEVDAATAVKTGYATGSGGSAKMFLQGTVDGWTAPVAGVVGSGFRTKARPGHDGVDFPAAKNTPIRAVAAGRVITVTCNASTANCDVDGGLNVKGCGWYVEILHPGDIVTRYCHMIRRPAVTEGQSVQAGQLIGNVGSSGNSSGPHLHFEVHTDAPAGSANATDPVSFMASRGIRLNSRTD